MYDWVRDKLFLSRMRKDCGEIMQDLCHQLREDCNIGASFYLIGSGAKNLILQNENQPIDLDYNVEIVRCDDYDACREIKDSMQKAFNKVLKRHGLRDCCDSKSSLTTRVMNYREGNKTGFSMDVAIVCRDEEDNLYRLIHNKTGYTYLDTYVWEKAKDSKGIRKKADKIKKVHAWDKVRQQYKDLKNRYIWQNDHNHPSYICYIEAVNNVYYSLGF